MARQSIRNERPLAEAMRDIRRAMRAENYSAHTRADYDEKWVAFARWLHDDLGRDAIVGDFTLETVRGYISYRLESRPGKRGLKPTSAGCHVRALRAIAGRFKAEGLTGEHRLAGLREPRLDLVPEARVLSEVERQALFLGARGVSATDRRNTAILAVLDDAGPRVSELVSIDHADVRLREKLILLRTPAKRGLVRVLPLGGEATRVLRDLVGTRARSGPLFVQRGGERMTDGAVRAVLVRLSERADVERVSPHDFRHTASTVYTTLGAPEALKYRVFGWKPDPRSMDQRYTHLSADQIVEAHQRYSPLDALAPFRRRRPG